MSFLPDQRLHRRALLASRIPMRANRIGTNLSRHDEGFGVVHHKWLKRATGAFYNRFFALDKV